MNVFRTIVLLVLLLPLKMEAQESKGIQFDKSLSWEEVLEKATRENKYIFMDVMATWCGPCKSMAELVFTNEEVGKFFNDHFICMKLQIDKTPQDNQYVKAWYKEVDVIHKNFNIRSVPTLLFFNSKGEIVHLISGATTNSSAFIGLGKDVLDENKQLYTRVRKYEAGERDVEFLYDLSMDLVMYGEKGKALQVANTFWQAITPEERLLDKGIRFGGDFVGSTESGIFEFFMEHPVEVDAVLGPGTANQKVMDVINYEFILPLVKDSTKMPDWEGICKDLCVKYPRKEKSITELVANGKMGYALRFHRDDLYLEALMELVPLCGEREDKMLTRSYAHALGKNAKNQEQRELALTWLKSSLDETDALNLARYAEVLFLEKQKKEGKKYLSQAMDVMKKGGIDYTEVTAIHEKYK